jgi:antitoxin component YwqK of YwqJK toxin-antitoxin module
MNKNKNGLTTELLDNGMTLQTNFENGLKHGVETYWYANGQIASEGNYLDNKLDGVLTYWYDNGTKASEGFYINDKPEGVQTAWNENGQIESEQEYKNGMLNGASIFYENGIKTAEYVLKNGDVVGDLNG